jgi:hypothetical protein
MSVAGPQPPKPQQLEAAMDPFTTSIIASSRREDYVREADNERLVRLARRDRKRHQDAEARPAPRHHEAARPVIA